MLGGEVFDEKNGFKIVAGKVVPANPAVAVVAPVGGPGVSDKEQSAYAIMPGSPYDVIASTFQR